MIKLKFWQKKKRQFQIDLIHYERDHTGKIKTKTFSRFIEEGSELTQGLRTHINSDGSHGVEVRVTEVKL